jgi:hypothetical protein
LLKPVLTRLDPSLSDVETSAEEYYWAGFELLVGGQHVRAGIYLLGYACEMWLKCAYFRLVGKGAADSITRVDLSTAKADAAALGVAALPESFHSVVFWRDLMLAKRSRLGRALLAPELVRGLVDCTARVYDNWDVSMRYHPDLSLVLNGPEMFGDLEWVRGNIRSFWR